MTIYDDADVNPPRPAFGHEYKKAMPWLHDETQFACEGCGDLVALEKAKLRDDIRDSIRLGTACETLQEVSQSRAYLLSERIDILSRTAVRHPPGAFEPGNAGWRVAACRLRLHCEIWSDLIQFG